MISDYERYTLRQMTLPIEYKRKMEHVKRTIRMITGRNVSTEITLMCLIDEFINAHEADHGAADMDVAHENVEKRGDEDRIL